MRFVSHIAVTLLSTMGWSQVSPPANPIVQADLRAWTRVEPLFIHAEKAFGQASDQRNALYAKLGRIRGELPQRSVADVSQELPDILHSPLATSLVIKWEADTDFDAALAEQDWREALQVAQRLNDSMWINRANGELGIITVLMGKTSEGLFQISSALEKAEDSKWSGRPGSNRRRSAWELARHLEIKNFCVHIVNPDHRNRLSFHVVPETTPKRSNRSTKFAPFRMCR